MNRDDNFVVFLNRDVLNALVKDAGFGFTPITDDSVAIINRAGEFKGFFSASANKGFLASGDGVAAGFAANELEINEHGYRDILLPVFSIGEADTPEDGVRIVLTNEPLH